MKADLNPLLELGAKAQGQVLDAGLWERESRCRVAVPVRVAAGAVMTVWPFAPHVVGIVTPAGEQLTIRAQR